MDQPVADADVLDRLKALAKDGPDTRVYVRASKTVPYGRVAEIMAEVTIRRLQEGCARHRAPGQVSARVLSAEDGSQRTGLAVSGAMHLALLAVLVFGFARAPRFDDAPESIPVETITSTQLNEIMEGEKTAKPAPTPPTRAAEARAGEAAAAARAAKAAARTAARRSRPNPSRRRPSRRNGRSRPNPNRRRRSRRNARSRRSRSPKRRRARRRGRSPQKPEETPKPPERPRPPKPEPTKAVDKFKPDEIAKALASDKETPKPKARLRPHRDLQADRPDQDRRGRAERGCRRAWPTIMRRACRSAWRTR